MRLRLVTVTGADDGTQPEELLALANEFPWVEWGILVSARAWSANADLRPASPSRAWIERLNHDSAAKTRLSFHLCGKWAWGLTEGVFPEALTAFIPMLARLQLNVAGLQTERDPSRIAGCLPRGIEYIIQVGADHTSGVQLARSLRELGVDASVLFDASGGKGRTPETWPVGVADVPCGYAGGLGPDTLEGELRRLEKIVGDGLVWIDMQSLVRSENGQRFDLAKVRQCLTIAAMHAGVAG